MISGTVVAIRLLSSMASRWRRPDREVHKCPHRTKDCVAGASSSSVSSRSTSSTRGNRVLALEVLSDGGMPLDGLTIVRDYWSLRDDADWSDVIEYMDANCGELSYCGDDGYVGHGAGEGCLLNCPPRTDLGSNCGDLSSPWVRSPGSNCGEAGCLVGEGCLLNCPPHEDCVGGSTVDDALEYKWAVVKYLQGLRTLIDGCGSWEELELLRDTQAQSCFKEFADVLIDGWIKLRGYHDPG